MPLPFIVGGYGFESPHLRRGMRVFELNLYSALRSVLHSGSTSWRAEVKRLKQRFVMACSHHVKAIHGGCDS